PCSPTRGGVYSTVPSPSTCRGSSATSAILSTHSSAASWRRSCARCARRCLPPARNRSPTQRPDTPTASPAAAVPRRPPRLPLITGTARPERGRPVDPGLARFMPGSRPRACSSPGSQGPFARPRLSREYQRAPTHHSPRCDAHDALTAAAAEELGEGMLPMARVGLDCVLIVREGG